MNQDLRRKIKSFTDLKVWQESHRLVVSWGKKNSFHFKIKPFFITALALLILFLPIAWLITSQPKAAEAGWWDDNWYYRKEITISYTGSSTLTEYQVLIDDFDTATLISDGKMQAHCEDIRFTDINGTLLDYSIVGNTCNTSTTKIWVKTTQITNGGGKIYLYYNNPSADPYQDESATFSYSSEKTVAYVLHSAVDDLQVISFEDGNSITHNSTTLSLDKYDTSSFSSISQWGPITAKKVFNADDQDEDTDLIVPVSWAGTEFYFYSRDAAETTTIWAIAPWQDATVTVYDAGVAVAGCTSVSVTSAGATLSCANTGAAVIRVSSNYPILIFTQPTDADDQMPVHPATTQKWIGGGVNSAVVNGNASLDHRYYYDTAAAEQDDADVAANSSAGLSGDDTYGRGAMLIRSADSNTNYGAQQYGDGDGGDAHYFNDETEQGTRFGSANQADYISVASTQAATCTVYNTDGGPIDSQTLTSSNTSIYHYGFGTGDTSTYTNGAWYMECDKQVSAHYQKAETSEENLMSYPMMRQFTYPTPSTSVGSEEQAETAPVAYWRFDEGQGTTTHNQMEKNSEYGLVSWWKLDDASSGTSPAPQDEMETNDCTWEGNASYTSSAKVGNAATFDGADDYLDCGSDTSLRFTTQPFTITAWIYLDDATAEEIVASDDVTNGYGLLIASGNLRLITRGTTDDLTDSSGTVSTGAWTHVAGVYTGTDGQRKLYINGSLDITESFTGSANIADDPVYIGMRTDGGNDFSGEIDSVKIYNRILSDGEISADYNSSHGHMINMDDTTDWVNGKYGKTLDFDGTNDYLDIGDQNSLKITGAITVEAWVKTSDTVGGVVSKMETGALLDGSYTLRVGDPNGTSDGKPVFLIYSGDTSYDVTSTITINDNKWHHLSGTFNPGSSLQIYIDGVLNNTTSVAVSSIDDTTYHFNIGRETPSETNVGYLSGSIDDVKIYHYTRTAAQIKTDYQLSLSHGAGVVLGAGSENAGTPPVSWWKLDEGSNTSAFDSGSEENTGTLTNMDGSTDWVAGKYGKSLEFDGTDDYVNFGDPSSLLLSGKSFTIAHWVKTSSATAQGIFHKYYVAGSPNDFWGDLLNADGTFGFQMRDSILVRYYMTGSTVLNDNAWHHLAVTWDEDTGTGTMYVDGIDEDPTIVNDGNPGDIDNTSNVYLGGPTWGYFNGKIDDVRVYDYVRTAEQIRQDMLGRTGSSIMAAAREESSPVVHYRFDEDYGTTVHNEPEKNGENGLIGWWKMNEGTGTTLDDEIGLNDASLENSPSWTSGKTGSAVDFESTSSQYANVGDNDLYNESYITVSAWINPESFVAGAPILNRRTAANVGGFTFELSSTNGLRMYVYVDGAWRNAYSGDNTISTGSWQHVAGTYDGQTISVYIDNVLKATTSYPGTMNQPSSPSVWIGRNIAVDTNYFDGIIDDVKFFNRALSTSEISSIYNSNQGHMINMSASSDWVTGKFGKSLDFDGTDDYVAIADSKALSPTSTMSISAWIYPDNTPDDTDGIVAKRNNNVADSEAYQLGITTDRLIEWVTWDRGPGGSGNYKVIQSTIPVPLNQWSYVAGTFSSGTIKVYINGVDVSDTPTGIGTAIGDTSNELMIGAFLNSSVLHAKFDGRIDEVKIYNFALTANQIKLDYNHGSAVVLGAGSEAAQFGGAGPIAFWKFDETNGATANEISGNGYNGTVTGATWTKGKIGNALSFDGTDDYVDTNLDTPFDFGTDNFAISMWVKRDITAQRYLAGKYDGSSHGWILEMYEDSVLFDIYTDGSNRVFFYSSEPTDTNWHHILCQRTSLTNADCYQDGRLLQADTKIGVGTAYADSTSDFFIGSISGAGNLFDGKIDHVKIYDYALSVGQIAYEYNRGKPVAHWRFDEKESTTAYDESVNDNDCTLTNMDSSTDWIAGKFNSALDLDGSNDLLSCGTGSSLDFDTNDFTLSGWFKTSRDSAQSNSFMSIIMKGNTSSPYERYELAMVMGATAADRGKMNVQIDCGASTIEVNSTQKYNDGKWHHAVGIRSGDNLYLYIDGIYIASNTGVDSCDTDGGSNFIIGGNMNGAGTQDQWEGQLDEIRIYNYARTADQIKLDYNNGAAVRFN